MKKENSMSWGALWCVVAGCLALGPSCTENSSPKQSQSSPPPASPVQAPSSKKPETTAAFPDYAGSQSCRGCHEEVFELWRGSHHALAERQIDWSTDREAFDPPHEFRHGSQQSAARVSGDKPEIVTLGRDGKQAFTVERVFGVWPLRQFLVAAPGGRYQATEIAYDPQAKEWFNVFGNEDRLPGEWGHWTGQGMTWNSMCAACHNTRLEKNYDEKSDSYSTRRAEMGVGCEACHGPMAEHVKWQQENTAGGRDPTVPRFSPDQILDTCGSCHARRTEIDGKFQPGRNFLDHFLPAIVDDTDVYYPDGQVREENFEYVSFLSSLMYTKGVRCIDCHEPHSGKTKFAGNDLCLQCHKEKIDPGSHSRHAPGQPGGRCVDCHMPVTTYMQRHPRRDHGFTIPDPLLTKEHGVPNACNRCHSEKSVDWAVAAYTEWYGSPLERHTQKRARWVAKARLGDSSARDPLMQLSKEDPIPAWRASATALLGIWSTEKAVEEELVARTQDPHPLVRSLAARALEPLGPFENEKTSRALRRTLRDPLRAVRIEAAWALRHQVDPGSDVGAELWEFLKFNIDQPAGALRMAVYNMDRGYAQAALPYLQQAVSWDGHSAPLRQALAVCLSAVDRPREAVTELQVACRLKPEDPSYRFYLGLALAETRRPKEAVEAFTRTVELDPSFVRAWYNLGLARANLGDIDGALAALEHAGSLDPDSPEPLHAQATVLFQEKRFDEALQRTQEVLELAPDFQPALRLRELIESGKE